MTGNLAAQPLCTVDIEVTGEGTTALGRSPWRNRRVTYIAGGTISGERLSGVVLPGGGDWSELGGAEGGPAVTLVDVRSVWRTSDEALIYVTYSGRLVIPPEVLGDFRDPAKVEAIDPARYYFRIQPVFETADSRYDWLNAAVAVGYGRRTANGVRYRVFTLD